MKWHFENIFSSEYWSKVFRGRHTWGGRINKWMRICISSIRGFSDDDCSEKASALTFYSLLSIIPVLAVAFGIAKGFGFEQHLEDEITQRFSEMDISDKLIDFAQTMLENAQTGVIAGVGLAVLFWSVLKLMGSIESSFNAIWKIKTPRSWSRRLSDYLAMMLFCPLFFAISSSLSVFIISQLRTISESNGVLHAVSPIIFLAFHLFPLVLSWMLFTALYYIMPNAKVPLRYALIAGIAAGTVYQIVQWIYIKFQIGVASYGAIYGSFAALPLFLLWLNISWYIALGGAEIAYHAENDMSLSPEAPESPLHHTDARVIGLILMQACIRAFCQGERPPSIYNLAKESGLAVFSTRQLVHQLLEASLLVEVTWRDGLSGYYQPGRDLKNITLKDVCDALDTSRQTRFLVSQTPLIAEYETTLTAFDTLLQKAPENYSLDNILTHIKIPS